MSEHSYITIDKYSYVLWCHQHMAPVPKSDLVESREFPDMFMCKVHPKGTYSHIPIGMDNEIIHSSQPPSNWVATWEGIKQNIKNLKRGYANGLYHSEVQKLTYLQNFIADMEHQWQAEMRSGAYGAVQE